VPDIVVATDSSLLFDQVRSVLVGPNTSVRQVRRGQDVLPALQVRAADLVISDMQLGTMGGIAISMEIALETGAGRLDNTPVLVLLDRRADVFLTRRFGVRGWLVKPLDPIRLRRATQSLLAGEAYHDPSYMPEPVAVPTVSASMAGTGK
jgi:DNA-binding response OmpR family regulator